MRQGKSFAWSFSALNDFETCPHRYYKVRVLKEYSEPDSDYLTWGRRVHEAMDLALSQGIPLPESFSSYGAWLEPIREAQNNGASVRTEVKHALTVDLSPVEYFDKSVWVRCVSDVEIERGNTLTIFDWKTGRHKDESDQLRLNSAVAFASYPYITNIKTCFVYLAENKLVREDFSRDKVHALWSQFRPRVDRMQRAFERQEWPANPSGLCKRHCPVISCKYHGKGK